MVKEDNTTPISEQLEKVIKSLPKKEQKRLEALKKILYFQNSLHNLWQGVSLYK